jgi:ATP-binding cassette, subfamily B, bacterial
MSRTGTDRGCADAAPVDHGLLAQLWRFRAYGRRELRALLVGLGMRLGELGADLAAPWPLALVIDNVLRGRQPGGMVGHALGGMGRSPVVMLVVAAIAVLLTTAASGVFDYLGDRIMNGAGERITSRIRADVFAHMLRLPMRYHDRQAVGELTSRVSVDTGRIEDGLVKVFSVLVPGLLSIAGFAVVLVSVNWRLGLIALAAAPLMFGTAARYTRLTRVAARWRRAVEGRQSGVVAESLRGIRTVHAFGHYERHDRQFAAVNDEVLAAGLRAVDLRARFTPLMELTASLGTAALLFAGGYGVLEHWWSVGMLVVTTSYLRDMLKPIRTLGQLSMVLTQASASAERVAAILDQPRPEPRSAEVTPARPRGDIECRALSLDYGRGPVLRGVNLRVLPGERVALLGPNGAGKSSVLALIAGLYAPTQGQVVVDGLAVAEQPGWWRHRQIAIVLQDTFLFAGSIAENIRYARPDATDVAVVAAATAALVTEFTDRLPEGLNTELGDGGLGLSGGQRQRVGIARAMLTGAPIVLLDEPTSGLDDTAERLVVRALAQLATGRTVVMTSHRPALTGLATRVVSLRDGALVAPGAAMGTADAAGSSRRQPAPRRGHQLADAPSAGLALRRSRAGQRSTPAAGAEVRLALTNSNDGQINGRPRRARSNHSAHPEAELDANPGPGGISPIEHVRHDHER